MSRCCQKRSAPGAMGFRCRRGGGRRRRRARSRCPRRAHGRCRTGAVTSAVSATPTNTRLESFARRSGGPCRSGTVEDPVGSVEVDVEVARWSCVGIRREALGTGREISLVVLSGVAPQQEAPGGEQAEREQTTRPAATMAAIRAGMWRCARPGPASAGHHASAGEDPRTKDRRILSIRIRWGGRRPDAAASSLRVRSRSPRRGFVAADRDEPALYHRPLFVDH